MAERETLSFVIVGHVDHGKSTLIGRLLYDTDSLPPEKIEEIRKASDELGHPVELAYVMDQLSEERADSMTIDTAQAFFKSARRDYVIIDAPGHRELTKNMITGASHAEAAILVVDGAEGMQEQTRRHAYFVSMLGLDQVAVVINKMDKVRYDEARFGKVSAEVCGFLNSVGLTPSHVVPGSAMKGDNIVFSSDNMKWHSGVTLLGALEAFHAAGDVAGTGLRFPVQDVYPGDGRRILVGRVESGCIAQGQEVIFLPSRLEARVRSLEVFGEKPASAETGTCIGITVDPPLKLDRGEVACSVDDFPEPTRRFGANVFWMASAPCRAGETVTLRAATQSVPCTVEHIDQRIDSSTLAVIEEDATELGEMEVGRMVLSTARPVVLETFQDVRELGRIVLARDLDVIAGGLVTHASDAHLE